ncbi:MAG TPA: SRPBCC domain-containing protein [Puia sp.]|nr:SRPBCC domain-containing protein [Puia sp.]
MSTTQHSRLIKASPDKLYHAFTDPTALETWMAPGNMTGKVHSFDGSVGGGYSMSLFYPENSAQPSGKTTEREDRYTARFITLQEHKKIVMGIRFDSGSPGFVGEMIMEVRFERQGTATLVTIVFTNLPLGVRPEDNEKGTEQSLDKLEKYVQSI